MNKFRDQKTGKVITPMSDKPGFISIIRARKSNGWEEDRDVRAIDVRGTTGEWGIRKEGTLKPEDILAVAKYKGTDIKRGRGSLPRHLKPHEEADKLIIPLKFEPTKYGKPTEEETKETFKGWASKLKDFKRVGIESTYPGYTKARRILKEKLKEESRRIQGQKHFRALLASQKPSKLRGPKTWEEVKKAEAISELGVQTWKPNWEYYEKTEAKPKDEPKEKPTKQDWQQGWEIFTGPKELTKYEKIKRKFGDVGISLDERKEMQRIATKKVLKQKKKMLEVKMRTGKPRMVAVRKAGKIVFDPETGKPLMRMQKTVITKPSGLMHRYVVKHKRLQIKESKADIERWEKRLEESQTNKESKAEIKRIEKVLTQAKAQTWDTPQSKKKFVEKMEEKLTKAKGLVKVAGTKKLYSTDELKLRVAEERQSLKGRRRALIERHYQRVSRVGKQAKRLKKELLRGPTKREIGKSRQYRRAAVGLMGLMLPSDTLKGVASGRKGGRPRSTYKHSIPGRGPVPYDVHRRWVASQKRLQRMEDQRLIAMSQRGGPHTPTDAPEGSEETMPEEMATRDTPVGYEEPMEEGTTYEEEPQVPYEDVVQYGDKQRYEEEQQPEQEQTAQYREPSRSENILHAPNISRGELRNQAPKSPYKGPDNTVKPIINPDGDYFTDVDPMTGKPLLRRRVRERWIAGDTNANTR